MFLSSSFKSFLTKAEKGCFFFFYLTLVHLTFMALVQQPDREDMFVALGIQDIDKKVQVSFVQRNWSLYLEEKREGEC